MSINVIIADEFIFLRKVISEFLSKHSSINVIDTASTGKETVEKVKKYHPDVLILDLLILDMNGLETLELIMKECPTPTLILSEIDFENIDSSMIALLLGAFDFIIKPGEFGTKDLNLFKEEVLNKTLIASQSSIRKIKQQNGNLSNRRSFLRQDIINLNFKLGKKDNIRKSINELEEKSQFLRQRAINEDFILGKTKIKIFPDTKESSPEINISEKEIPDHVSDIPQKKTYIRQDIIHEIFKSVQISFKKESNRSNDILVEVKPSKLEKTRTKKKDIIKKDMSVEIPKEKMKDVFKPKLSEISEVTPNKEESTKTIQRIVKRIKKLTA